MNLIYLDIDGVLTNRQDNCMLFECKPEDYRLSTYNVSNLKRVIKHTNAQIILSTSWRNYPEGHTFQNSKGWEYSSLMDDVTKHFGTYIIGKAPHVDGSDKLNDIIESILIMTHESDINKIAVLDDDPSQGLEWLNRRGPEYIHWFKTTKDSGLDDKVRDNLIYFFNN